MNTSPLVPDMVARPQITAGLTRGAVRLLRHMGFQVLSEFKLSSARRADLMGLNKAGQFLMAEVKSSVADFRADTKWPTYLDYCDFFYFVVNNGFPIEILPDEHGIIIADSFDGEVLRMAAARKVNAVRRKAQMLRFALTGAQRLGNSTYPLR